METILYGACLLACGLQFALGIGVTLLARKRLPRAAYFLGFLAPILIPIVLYVSYIALTQNRPCPPEAPLSCGETDAYTFILLGGVLLFNLGISATIQFVIWLIERRNVRMRANMAPQAQ